MDDLTEGRSDDDEGEQVDCFLFMVIVAGTSSWSVMTETHREVFAEMFDKILEGCSTPDVNVKSYVEWCVCLVC